MDSASSRIEIWTEFFDPPAPEIQTVSSTADQTQALQTSLGPSLMSPTTVTDSSTPDQSIDFGAMRMDPGGQAFATGDGTESTAPAPAPTLD